jgi:PAS domain S-box-containing protein
MMPEGVGELSRAPDLRSTLEAIDEAAFVFDNRAQLVFINSAALRIFGFASFAEAVAAVEGRSGVVRVVRLHGRPGIPADDLVRRALAGEEVTEELERVAPPDGRPQVVLRMNVRPIRDPHGAVIGALKFGHDVTFEYELARLKEEFVRVTSHELRTPAAILRLAAHRLLLAADGASPAELRKRAETIDRATRRIEAISLKLVDIATISAGDRIALEPAPLSLDSLVADIVASVDDAEARRVHLAIAPAVVRGDSKRLRQVLDSILDNALRYSAAPASVEVVVGAHDGVAEVSIADHGVGIPAAKQPHVFGQFYRAHTGTPVDSGGLGASLYLAAHIIEAHGGRIWFESEETRGSTFHLALDSTALH